MKTLERTILSTFLILPFAIPITVATVAENTPESEWRCEMNNDVTFAGDDVTVRTCSAYGFEVSKRMWKKGDARLVCVSNDPERIRFYANEEDDFDQVHCAAIWENSY